ncbi:alpha/beta hydrolase [Nocardioides sp. YIM B13467]|uniref:alpha/beta hydrolase n=1 Tax=Nocardioides sp. YIM B13467 TaxID=3366294 RepID=UPI003672A57B
MIRYLKLLGPSATSRVLVAGARLAVRPQIDRLRLEGLQLRYLRGVIAAGGVLAGWPTTARAEQVRTTRFEGEWVRARNAEAGDDGVIIYFHGGGYVASSPRSYRCVTGPLSALSALPVLAVGYRRAPEHVYPAALDDAVAAYDWLLAQGHPPERIVVAGDSAGGHLALGLLTTLARCGRDLPAGVTLFSPLLDPALTEAVRRDARHHDPVLTPTFAARCAEAFHPGGDFHDPCLSPLTVKIGLLRTFPPIQTHVGGTECFAGDSERLHERLTRAGVPNKLIVSRGQIHSYVTMYRLVPEARRAVRRAATFLRSCIDEDVVVPSSSSQRLAT